jgi:hypothetical protein
VSPPLPRRGRPTQPIHFRSNYSILDRKTEGRLVLAAQAGDEAAGDKLVPHHLPWIRSQLPFHWEHYEEAVQIAVLALWRAVLAWEPGRGGLNALYRAFFFGAVLDFRREMRNGAGFTGTDTRIQRYLRTHRRFEYEAERIQKDFPDYTLVEIEEEKEIAHSLIKPTVGYLDQIAHVRSGDVSGGGEGSLGTTQEMFGAMRDGARRQRGPLDPRCVSEYSRRATNLARLLDTITIERAPPKGYTGPWAIFPCSNVPGRPLPKDWRPQSGVVDDTDIRGFGEGRSCVRSGSLSLPFPIPPGQETNARASLWNARRMWGSLNTEPAAPIHVPARAPRNLTVMAGEAKIPEDKNGYYLAAHRSVSRNGVREDARRVRAGG